MTKNKQDKKQSKTSLQEIINRGDKAELRALFSFDRTDTEQEFLLKYNLWARYFFPKFYKFKDADFHKDIDKYNYRVYANKLKFFVNVVFRGGAKTTRTKLFVAFCIANDTDHQRKYFKILTKDISNAKQIVTDIYNLLITIAGYYPEVFKKTDFKKEERMDSFTTFTGIKMRAGTVGTEQRGQIQEEARPDWIWHDDFETRKTLRSAIETKTIWDNMEEAKTGLSKTGGAVYTCNYLSERGNVHKLIQKKDNENTEVLIVPIKFDGEPMWDFYSIEEINAIEKDVDDFAGEYLCLPSAGYDIFFDRESLERQITKEPLRTVAGFKIFYEYNPSHRYGMGADVGGGVGLDHSTTVFWDFTTMPARVVATFKSNTIKPDIFGDEIKNEAERFGEPIVAPENNKFDMCIGRLKQIYKNIYFTEQKETRAGIPPKTRTYGWNTNRMSKPKKLFDLKKAVEDGHAELTDADLVAELKSYTRDDLMDVDDDPRLTTRHFDLLTACFVKGTPILTDKGQRPIETISIGDIVMTRNGYKKVVSTFNHIQPVITNINLTGTPNHPVFCNDNQIKDLSGVSRSDILYIWNLKAQKIERLSYTKARHIIDTQMQTKEITGSILAEEQNGRNQQPTYIGKYGLIILGIFRKALLYITKIIILSIMTLKILVYCLLANILRYIQQKKEKSNSEQILRKTEKISIEELKNTIKIKNQEKLSVPFARNLLKRFQKMLFFVRDSVFKDVMGKEKRDLNKRRFVQFAVKCLKLVFLLKKDVLLNALLCETKNQNKKKFVLFVEQYLKLAFYGKKDVQRNVKQRNIEKHTKKDIFQRVYNIQVADCPEYFANNILVHNCAIGFQMRNWAEAKSTEQVYRQPDYENPLLDN